MLGRSLDHLLYRALAGRRRAAARSWSPELRMLGTALGPVRVHDGGGARPCVLLVPDGPCVIEHYHTLIGLLRGEMRLVVADLPGFGFSPPSARYGHRLHEGASALLAILDALGIERAALAASCVNGYYAIAAAARAPARVSQLVLAQTPGFDAMQDWTRRIVPAPVRVPVLGQLLNFVQRRRIAHGWYAAALARRDDRAPFRSTAEAALRAGGCYCFAGVVQGMRGTGSDDPLLQPLTVPATLVWGSADRTHAPTAPDSLHRHLPGARILRFDTAGHFPDLENPQAYAQLLRERLL